MWFEDGTVTFGGNFGGEHGTHVGGGDREAPAFALDSLLADDDAVDFVKMDIEGAESVVLKRNVEWAAKVGAMKVEVHNGYTRAECSEDLRNLGFDVQLDDRHWASVIATRPT